MREKKEKTLKGKEEQGKGTFRGFYFTLIHEYKIYKRKEIKGFIIDFCNFILLKQLNIFNIFLKIGKNDILIGIK